MNCNAGSAESLETIVLPTTTTAGSSAKRGAAGAGTTGNGAGGGSPGGAARLGLRGRVHRRRRSDRGPDDELQSQRRHPRRADHRRHRAGAGDPLRRPAATIVDPELIRPALPVRHRKAHEHDPYTSPRDSSASSHLSPPDSSSMTAVLVVHLVTASAGRHPPWGALSAGTMSVASPSTTPPEPRSPAAASPTTRLPLEYVQETPTTLRPGDTKATLKVYTPVIGQAPSARPATSSAGRPAPSPTPASGSLGTSALPLYTGNSSFDNSLQTATAGSSTPTPPRPNGYAGDLRAPAGDVRTRPVGRDHV